MDISNGHVWYMNMHRLRKCLIGSKMNITYTYPGIRQCRPKELKPSHHII